MGRDATSPVRPPCEPDMSLFGGEPQARACSLLSTFTTGEKAVNRSCVRSIAALGLFATLLVSEGWSAERKKKRRKPRRRPDVHFVATPNDVVDMMLHLVRVKKDDVVYDLGCGDGRIVVAAAKKYGCKAIGYDIDPKRVKESLANVKKNKVERLVTIEEKDVFTLDLRPASVVTLYLLPELNVRLIPQLEKLKPGSRIVSHDFDMKGVKPDMTLTMRSKQDGIKHTIYVWSTPLRKVDKREEAEEQDAPELPDEGDP